MTPKQYHIIANLKALDNKATLRDIATAMYIEEQRGQVEHLLYTLKSMLQLIKDSHP